LPPLRSLLGIKNDKIFAFINWATAISFKKKEKHFMHKVPHFNITTSVGRNYDYKQFSHRQALTRSPPTCINKINVFVNLSI
jgi:hypothetical protein